MIDASTRGAQIAEACREMAAALDHKVQFALVLFPEGCPDFGVVVQIPGPLVH